MKKFFIFLVLIIFLCLETNAFAARGTVRELFNSEEVFSTGTATSVAVPIKSGGYFGVWYKATSAASAPDIKIEYEMSYDDTAANFVEPANATDIETNLTTETAKIKSLKPPPMMFLRIKVTGNAGNAADTVLSLRLFQQED